MSGWGYGCAWRMRAAAQEEAHRQQPDYVRGRDFSFGETEAQYAMWYAQMIERHKARRGTVTDDWNATLSALYSDGNGHRTQHGIELGKEGTSVIDPRESFRGYCATATARRLGTKKPLAIGFPWVPSADRCASTAPPEHPFLRAK